MRLKTLVSFLGLSTVLATPAFASDKAEFTLGLSGLKIVRENETLKPKNADSTTNSITAADLFGLDGQSALPFMEFGLHINEFVIYAYPNAAAGGRELWLGVKATDETEFGLVIGTNQLAFSPPQSINGKAVKTEATNRLGLFANHRQSLMDLKFDFNLNPWYSMVTSTYDDRALNQQSSELGVAAEVLWVWDVAENLEVASGPSFGWSKTTQKQNGEEVGTINWSQFGVTLAQTTYSF